MRVAFEDLFGVIKKAARATVRDHSYALKADIQRVWPVKTGASKAGWAIRGNQHGWVIVNHVVSPKGYDYVQGLWHGSSQQLPLGGDPIVRARRELLMQSLRKMQFNKRTGGTSALRRVGRPPFVIK